MTSQAPPTYEYSQDNSSYFHSCLVKKLIIANNATLMSLSDVNIIFLVFGQFFHQRISSTRQKRQAHYLLACLSSIECLLIHWQTVNKHTQAQRKNSHVVTTKYITLT